MEHEQKGAACAQYGKQLLAELSAKLTVEFGTGFSERNLRNMRKFYLVYQGRFKQIWQMPSAKLIESQKGHTLSGQSKTVNLTEISQMTSGKLGRSV